SLSSLCVSLCNSLAPSPFFHLRHLTTYICFCLSLSSLLSFCFSLRFSLIDLFRAYTAYICSLPLLRLLLDLSAVPLQSLPLHSLHFVSHFSLFLSLSQHPPKSQNVLQLNLSLL